MGAWDASIQAFVRGARVPEGGPWTFLSLLSATEYRPQEVREGRPSQEEQDRAQNSLEYFACCQPLGPYLVAKD